jgi:transposase
MLINRNGQAKVLTKVEITSLFESGFKCARKQRAKTEDVSSYFAELCLDCVHQGVKNLTVFLDNNTTHKQKMRNLLQVKLAELNIQGHIELEFLYTPPYSPNFNLAEYLVHQLRLQVLHHQPVDLTIQLVREKLQQYLHLNQLHTPQQIHAHNCSYLFPGQISLRK